MGRFFRHAHHFTVASAVLLLFVALAQPLRAQPMIEQVPKDAIVYIGWQGVDGVGAAYDASHLKGVLDATQLDAIVSQWLPVLVREAEAQEALAIAQAVMPLAWHRPWAAYLVAAPTKDADAPTGGLVIDAGDQVDQVRGLMQQAIESFDGPGEPPRLFEQGTLLTLTVGAVTRESSLATSERFQAALGQGVGSPALTIYVDAAGVQAQVDMALAEEGERASGTWRRVRDALGLSGIEQAVYTAGFDGQGWRSRAWVHMPASQARAGLPALLAAPPITDEQLALVPRTATWVSISRFGAANLFDVIRRTVQAADPQAGKQFDQGLADVSARVGTDLEAGLIRGLGDTWVMYSDPAVAGPMGYGLVLVNPLVDASGVQAALTKLEALANAQMAEEGVGPFGGGMRFRTMTSGGMEIHSLTFPMFAPSWAVHDGKLYIALFPQAIVSAAMYAQQEGQSILENPTFQAIRATLGDHAAASLSFTDLPVTIGAAYQSYLMLTQMLTAMMPGDDAPTMLLPPLAALMPYVTPAGSIAWADETGWHVASTSPFPGSGLFNQQAMMNPFGGPTVTAIGVGVALPALGAARRTARRMQATTQGRGIHQACVTYAQGSAKGPNGGGTFPPDFPTLLRGNYFTPEYLVSPFADGPPADFLAWPQAQQDAWVQQHASFVLLPGLTDTIKTEDVALFLKPGHSNGGGIAIVYQDNRAIWTPMDEAAAIIRAQTGLSIEALVTHAEAGTLRADTPGYTLPASEAPRAPAARF